MIELSVLETIELKPSFGAATKHIALYELRKAEARIAKNAFVVGVAFHPFENNPTRDINFFHHARDHLVLYVGCTPLDRNGEVVDSALRSNPKEWISEDDMISLSDMIPMSLFSCVCATMLASEKLIVFCDTANRSTISLDIVGAVLPHLEQDTPS